MEMSEWELCMDIKNYAHPHFVGSVPPLLSPEEQVSKSVQLQLNKVDFIICCCVF